MGLGTSQDTEIQAYQTPFLLCTSLREPGQDSLQNRPVVGLMHLQRHALLDPPEQPEADAVGVTHFVQRPVLVVGFQGQPLEGPDLLGLVDRANSLVHPRRTQLHVRERGGGQSAAFCFGHTQDAVRKVGVHPFQARPLRCFDLVQVQKRQFEGQGLDGHVLIVAYPVQRALTCSLAARRLSAMPTRCSAFAFIPPLKQWGFLRTFL